MRGAPTLIVTRPQPQADDWVTRLRHAGFDAAPLPLLAIEPVANPDAVSAARQRLPQYALAMFVSPAAVEHFMRRAPGVPEWPATTLAAAPGPGTAHALRAAGVPAAQVIEPAADAPQFDSEQLWRELAGRDWRGLRVLLVRGDGGREWLADTLRQAGAAVEVLQAYSRASPTLDASERELLRMSIAQPAARLWLFSSSQAIGHLRRLAPEADWRAAAALASHPRIAASARALGFGSVHDTAPSFDAVLRTLATLRQDGAGAAH